MKKQIIQAAAKLASPKVALGTAAVATGTAYAGAEEDGRETIEDIAMLGGMLATAPLALKGSSAILNKIYQRRSGRTLSKIMQNTDIEMPGFYSSGIISQPLAVGKEAIKGTKRIVDQFFNFNKSAGQRFTGIGPATQESIDNANKARLVANQAGKKKLSGYSGKMTKEAVKELKLEYNSLDEMKNWRKTKKVAHYNIEKDYMMLKKTGRPIPGALRDYMEPHMREAGFNETTRVVGKERMDLIGERWNKELKGTFASKDTKYFINKNTNPDSVNWDMMKDPVYHNLMVDLQNKPGGKGLYFDLDDVFKYGKDKGLNVRKLKNGNILLDYSPQAKSNYLKGGTRALVEFSQSSKGARVRPEFVNSDVFDLFGVPVGKSNTIIISEPYKPGLKAINFLKRERKAYSSSGRKDASKVGNVDKEIYKIDPRFDKFKPTGGVSDKVMNKINIMAKDATQNYNAKMDPEFTERLVRRAAGAVALGTPIGVGLYGFFSDSDE